MGTLTELWTAVGGHSLGNSGLQVVLAKLSKLDLQRFTWSIF